MDDKNKEKREKVVPELRFPEFKYKGEWEKKKLGEVCNIQKGEQRNKQSLKPKGDYPVINGGIEPSGYIDEYNTDENTVTISEGGNSCGYVNFIDKKFWSGGHCYTLLNIKLYDKYLYHLLKFNEKQLMKMRVGSGLPNIQKKNLVDFVLSIPSLPEQEKISDCISSLDEMIEAQEKKLELLKKHKKGLMQKLFPNKIGGGEL